MTSSFSCAFTSPVGQPACCEFPGYSSLARFRSPGSQNSQMAEMPAALCKDLGDNPFRQVSLPGGVVGRQLAEIWPKTTLCQSSCCRFSDVFSVDCKVGYSSSRLFSSPLTKDAAICFLDSVQVSCSAIKFDGPFWTAPVWKNITSTSYCSTCTGWTCHTFAPSCTNSLSTTSCFCAELLAALVVRLLPKPWGGSMEVPPNRWLL